MASDKIVISKINSAGTTRTYTNVTPTKAVTDQIDGRALTANYCDQNNDGITTYVQKKEWVIAENDYRFPPYVGCEYVE